MVGQHCNTTVNQLIVKFNSSSLKFDDVSNLSGLCDLAYEKEADDRFSEPLVGIGVYIAVASAICFIAMVVDFVFVWKRVGQIPYGHFPLNALAITVLSVAMKLPLDMTGSMPGYLDQATKLGSIVFMCTMMANLIPSLASMNSETLFSNILALAIFVFTIIGNLLIEMITGVVDGHSKLRKFLSTDEKLGSTGYKYDQSIFHGYFAVMAYLYIGSMLFLLVISVSAAVAIPSMKTILESKYQVKRKALDSKEPTTIVELKQHVSKYWIMANTGSLPVVFTSGPLFATSLCICIVCSVTYVILRCRRGSFGEKYASDYKWSMRVIFVVQSLGIAAGNCTLILRYYKSSKIFRNYYNPTRVEEFWYTKLCEWKGRHIRLTAAADLRAETVVHTVRGTFLNLLIMFQFVFVLIYKFLGSASLIILVINYVFKRIRSRPIDSSGHEDLGYALCVGGDVKVYRYAMHYLEESMDRLVKKAEKKQNTELLELLKKSNGVKEGQKFAIDQVQIPPSVELKSWSLLVTTLTCIAIVFPDRQDRQKFIKGVDQALEYTHLVEEFEGFHSEDEYANMHKKTMDFWYEVKAESKWLENSLKRKAFRGKTPTEILKWFDDKAGEAIVTSKSTVVDVEVEPLENYPDLKLMICKSMQSISRSILFKYENGSQLSTKVEFFELLSSMIADILFACFSNIPQAITKKCQAKEIEKREASVEAAVKILARTTKILEMFGSPKLPLPVLDQREMESVEKWRHPLIQPPTDPELSAV